MMKQRLVENEEDMVEDQLEKMIFRLLQRLPLSVLSLEEYRQILNKLGPWYASLILKKGLTIIFYAVLVMTKLTVISPMVDLLVQL